MIRARLLFACLLFLALPAIASAQNTMFGTLLCDSAAVQRAALKGDRGSAQSATVVLKCSWTVPVQIQSDVAADAQATLKLEIQGNDSKDAGDLVCRMTNSDQVTLRLTGASVFDGGDLVSQTGTWSLANGTGALKGVTGQGTYDGLHRASGGMSYDIEGLYTMPLPPAPATAAPRTTPAPTTTPPAGNAPANPQAQPPKAQDPGAA